MSVFKVTCVAFLGLLVSPVSASTIMNGSFDDGLNGYSVDDFSAAVPATDLATVATTSGGNNYLSLEARPLVGGFGVTASQTVMIDALAPILSFDAAVISEEEILNGVPSNRTDALSVSILLQGSVSPTTLFQLNSSLNPLGAFTSFTAAPDSIFESTLGAFSVVADLSAYAGETATLSFSGFNFESVITQSFFGVDNIEFSAVTPISAVPVPFSAGLLLTGLFAFGAVRRR